MRALNCNSQRQRKSFDTFGIDESNCIRSCQPIYSAMLYRTPPFEKPIASMMKKLIITMSERHLFTFILSRISEHCETTVGDLASLLVVCISAEIIINLTIQRKPCNHIYRTAIVRNVFHHDDYDRHSRYRKRNFGLVLRVLSLSDVRKENHLVKQTLGKQTQSDLIRRPIQTRRPD